MRLALGCLGLFVGGSVTSEFWPRSGPVDTRTARPRCYRGNILSPLHDGDFPQPFGCWSSFLSSEPYNTMKNDCGESRGLSCGLSFTRRKTLVADLGNPSSTNFQTIVRWIKFGLSFTRRKTLVANPGNPSCRGLSCGLSFTRRKTLVADLGNPSCTNFQTIFRGLSLD